jgi:hypothetical protein
MDFTHVLLVLMALMQSSAHEPEWPQFRGPGANGVSEVRGAPLQWSSTEHLVWKADVPGLGWSSPVVAGKKIFLTSVLRDGGDEEPQMGLYLGKSRPGTSRHWDALCYDLDSGRLLWQQELKKGDAGAIHLKNSYASATPVTDGERLYVWFGDAGLYCLDLKGKVLWSAPALGGFKTRNDWGSGASPVLSGDRLFLVNDNEEHSFVVALDKVTGRELWRRNREKETNWSTPFVWKNESRTELVVSATSRVVSYDLDGNELWSLRGMSSITIPTPFSAHGLLYVASGYFQDSKRPVYAIRPGGSGDLLSESSKSTVAWSLPAAAPYNPTPIVYGDQIYVLLDQGFLASYDARTGAEVYGKQRIDKGSGNFTSSPWACDGKIYCLSEKGETFVIQAGPTYKVLAKNPLQEACLSTPAIVGRTFILRTGKKLYRIG